MNDSELDQLLDAWRAPAPSISARAKALAGFRTRQSSRRFLAWIPRTPLLAGAAAMLALVWASQALPQTFRVAADGWRVPYTVESEYTDYESGVPTVYQYTTSYMHGTREFMLSFTIPDHPVETMHNQTIAWIQQTMLELSAPFRAESEQKDMALAAALVKNGCVNGTVVGRETILGFQTVGVQRGYGRWRRTEWMAPDLNCFPLKQISEKEGPDGKLRVRNGRRAVKVVVK